MKITLEQNIKRMQNCLHAVKQLSDPHFNIQIRRKQRRMLRKTLKTIKRLQVVIQKQLMENGLYYFNTNTVNRDSLQLAIKVKIDVLGEHVIRTEIPVEKMSSGKPLSIKFKDGKYSVES